MENGAGKEKLISVALVRGDYLNEWEAKLWEGLPNVRTVGFCSKKNTRSLKNLKLQYKKLVSTSDNFLLKNFYKYFFGQYKKMFGLEKELVNFDIAHTMELYNDFTTAAIRAKKMNSKLKVVVHVADNTFGRFEYNYWPGFKIAPAFWRNKMNEIIANNIKGADYFTAMTGHSKELLIAYGVPEEKIEILTQGVIVPDKNEPLSILELRELEGDVYLMVNRMVKSKGIYEALYGWKLYLNSKPNGKKTLVIIGDGPESENMQRLAKDLNMSDSVKFFNNIPNWEIKKMLRRSKCLILDSLPNSVWQEQFGFVLAEAIMSDCPVLTTHSGAIPEVVEDAGILVSPGQPVEIREALRKMDDEKLYSELKQNCEKVKNKFSARKFQENLVNIYRKITNS